MVIDREGYRKQISIGTDMYRLQITDYRLHIQNIDKNIFCENIQI